MYEFFKMLFTSIFSFHLDSSLVNQVTASELYFFIFHRHKTETQQKLKSGHSFIIAHFDSRAFFSPTFIIILNNCVILSVTTQAFKDYP